MAYSQKSIAISRLQLDQKNARLGEVQPNQQATFIALARQIGTQLFDLADDILENGLDPMVLIAVTPEGANSGHYRVIEGNRRVLTLKALETPSIVDAALTSSRRTRLASLSKTFRESPIDKVNCVIFDTEESARHWIVLRHTGANKGVGLVEWDANEQDRYKSRHGGSAERSPAGQVMDFVDEQDDAPTGSPKIITTVKRMISTPAVREKFGIEIRDGRVYSYYPAAEVAKPLTRMVADLRSGDVKVGAVYLVEDRLDYIAALTADDLPDPDARLPSAVPLTELAAEFKGTSAGRGPVKTNAASGATTSATSAGTTMAVGAGTGTSASGGRVRVSRVKPPKQRATLIPTSCALVIRQGRINAIFHELRQLHVQTYTNAAAISLRVFVELSVDHHIVGRSLMTEAERRSTPLAKRLKKLAADMVSKNEIPGQLEQAIIKIADGAGMFSASTMTFNQYVHNQYAYPGPSELLGAWDELQPFLQALWKK